MNLLARFVVCNGFIHILSSIGKHCYKSVNNKHARIYMENIHLNQILIGTFKAKRSVSV